MPYPEGYEGDGLVPSSAYNLIELISKGLVKSLGTAVVLKMPCLGFAMLNAIEIQEELEGIVFHDLTVFCHYYL